MLQTIRERAQGWIAWAIVILISIPFALWGIQSYLGVGGEPVVATINGVEITERAFDNQYHETRMRLRERLGAAYRPELFDDKKMRNQVLDNMIRDTMLLQVAHDLGLRAADQELREAILTSPTFQKDGRFDKATYERMLELQGVRPPQYEDELRQRIVRTQLARAIVASELVTNDEIDEAVRLERQQRRVSFVRIPKAAFVDEEPMPDDDVQSYYEANLSRFQTPERVKVRYLVLDSEKIDTGSVSDEEELRRLYDEDKDRFRQPELRAARHILITLDTDADTEAEAAAMARIEEIRSRIEAGEDFAELARESSDDPGSAGEGGNLGTFERGLMDPAFDQAAFSLAQDELSAPVRSQFGYHLIQVTEIQPESIKSFDEVRDQLASDVAKSNAEGAFYDLAERLANLSYENSDSLEPAAEALGLTLQTSDWIDRSGGEGLLAHPKVVAAAFSDDVLREGLNSDLIEPQRDVQQAVVLRVLEHEEAAAKPLDEVREEIAWAVRDQRAMEAAKAAADEMVGRLKAGGDLEVVAGDHKLTELGLVSREDASVLPGVRELAYKLPRPQADGVSYDSGTLDQGDAALVLVAEVLDGSVDALGEPERAQAKVELERAMGSAYYDELVSDLESRADIERKPLRETSSL